MKRKSMRTSIRFLAVVSMLSVSVVSTGFGLGFRNPDQDARATAQGEAFVAQADSPSALYYNPGGLTQLKGTAVSGGSFVTFRDIQLDGADGDAELNDPAFSGHAYAATDFGLERWRFAVGVNIPFGNAEDYGDHTPFRYQLTSTSLQVRNYAAGV